MPPLWDLRLRVALGTALQRWKGSSSLSLVLLGSSCRFQEPPETSFLFREPLGFSSPSLALLETSSRGPVSEMKLHPGLLPELALFQASETQSLEGLLAQISPFSFRQQVPVRLQRELLHLRLADLRVRPSSQPRTPSLEGPWQWPRGPPLGSLRLPFYSCLFLTLKKKKQRKVEKCFTAMNVTFKMQPTLHIHDLKREPYRNAIL